MNCSKCQAELKSGQMVCRCGQIVQLPEFKTNEAKQLIQKNADILSAAVQDDKLSTQQILDVSLQKYDIALAKIEAVLNTSVLQPFITKQTLNNLKKMRQQCADSDFHIALVGAIKAGKSTLINAILGEDLASTEVTPETASLTKFRKSQGKNYLKVSFYTDSEWSECWQSAQNSNATVFQEEYKNLNADNHKATYLGKAPLTDEYDTISDLKAGIKKWTSSKSPEHYFVKEVEVGLSSINLPYDVIYVDTPGLDDVVEYRSNITRDYIDRANAVLVCVNSTTLRGEELKTISSVFANTRFNPQKVYVVATQIDRLNNPQKDWPKQSAEWLKYLKGVGYFNDDKLAQRNLIPVSAYLYTMLQKSGSKLNDDEQMELESMLLRYRVRLSEVAEKYDELLKQTYIDQFKMRIQKEIVDNHREYHRQDITEKYEACCSDLMKIMAEIKQVQEELAATSSQSIEEIRQKREACAAQLEEAKADRQQMEKEVSHLKGLLKERLSNMTRQIMEAGVR